MGLFDRLRSAASRAVSGVVGVVRGAVSGVVDTVRSAVGLPEEKEPAAAPPPASSPLPPTIIDEADARAGWASEVGAPDVDDDGADNTPDDVEWSQFLLWLDAHDLPPEVRQALIDAHEALDGDLDADVVAVVEDEEDTDTNLET